VRPIRAFAEYVKEGIVARQRPDLSRATFLTKESQKSEVFLHQILTTLDLNDQNANTIIKLAYDIIMECIRARMIREGYHASGQGAHEAEVAYLVELGFSQADVQFCDQLRYFRNGIMYYGKSFNADYATKVVAYLRRIKKRLG
jgi:hypothetical protein